MHREEEKTAQSEVGALKQLVAHYSQFTHWKFDFFSSQDSVPTLYCHEAKSHWELY